MDVRTAYLNGRLKEEGYMEQPPNMMFYLKKIKWSPPHLSWKELQRLALRLLRNLYGLKQSGCEWYGEIYRELVKMGLIRSEADWSVFHCLCCVIAIYVDDVILAGTREEINKRKAQLSAKFKMVDLGELKWILGFCVTCDRQKRTITLSQEKYIGDVLKRFDVWESHPLALPAEPGVQLSQEMSPKDDAEQEYMKRIPYREAVGSLMDAMISTRPDNAYALGEVARFSHNPGQQHWQAVLRIMKYLQKTINFVMTYGGTGDPQYDKYPVEWADASFAGDRETRGSVEGFFMMLYGGAVAWRSRMFKDLKLSSSDAEYCAASDAARDVCWFRSFFRTIGREINAPTIMWVDNQSALAQGINPRQTKG